MSFKSSCGLNFNLYCSRLVYWTCQKCPNDKWHLFDICNSMYCKLFVVEFVVIKCSQNRLNSYVRSELSSLYYYDSIKHFDCLFNCVRVHSSRLSQYWLQPRHNIVCCIIIICGIDIENGMLCNQGAFLFAARNPMEKLKQSQNCNQRSLDLTIEQRLFDNLNN